MYAISTLLFLVAGKASQVPKVTYYFSPNRSATLVRPLYDGWIHNVRTIVVDCVGLFVCLFVCLFVFFWGGGGRKGNEIWLAHSQKC